MNEPKIRMVTHPRNGIYAVRMIKAVKVYSRHCLVGDIVAVEEPLTSQRTIMPPQDGLSCEHAEYLIKMGVAVAYNPRPGDRLISVAPQPTNATIETPKVEAAVLPQQRTAERATMARQKAAI